ncbi:MAG TPA: dihydropteroate synthase [Cyclobacteriaceae bacterium]|nr:dihydropteroate synthase [Cyclobacteriaceae bacterium]
MKDTLFYQKKTLNIRGKLLEVGSPMIMGVVNVTPDSFYSGSRARDKEEILRMAGTMVLEGADIIDIGGYSTRPGAEDVSETEEMNRILPAIELIRHNFKDVLISVDTFRSNVAREAVNAGAGMINDISGGQLDENMVVTVARCKVPYVLMHTRGTPATMKGLTDYQDLIGEIAYYFSARINILRSAGIADTLLDPGIGFAKTVSQNFEILKNLPYFRIFELPLVIGVSRKSLIYKTLQIEPKDALNGSTVLNTIAVLNQASILRVHDVKAAKEVIRLTNTYLS